MALGRGLSALIPEKQSQEGSQLLDTNSIRDNRFLTAGEISIIRSTLNGLRQGQSPFDLIASGYTCGENPAEEAKTVHEYARAGATWWVEALDPWRCSSSDARKRIQLGPPRV
jgi:hypothetical protein